MSRFLLDLRRVYLPEDSNPTRFSGLSAGQFTSGFPNISSGFLGNIAAPLSLEHSANTSRASAEVCEDPLTAGLEDLNLPALEMYDIEEEPIQAPGTPSGTP